MSLIACTNNCFYQQDGCCTLEQAVTSSLPKSTPGYCVNFVPMPAASDQRGQSLPDIPHPDQL